MGPCLCGDVYCPSCGNPEAAILEEAEAQAIEAMAKANLRADEYGLCVRIGLAAVMECRDAINQTIKHLAESEANEI